MAFIPDLNPDDFTDLAESTETETALERFTRMWVELEDKTCPEAVSLAPVLIDSLLEESLSGPDIETKDYGGGDVMVRCTLCDSCVVEPHTWEQCARTLKSQLDDANGDLDEVQNELDRADDELADLEEELERLRTDSDEA